MRMTKGVQDIEGCYRTKIELENDIKRTKEQGTDRQAFIPKIRECIIDELEKQLEKVQKQIDEIWTIAESEGREVAIQGAFEFYWECSIGKEETPL